MKPPARGHARRRLATGSPSSLTHGRTVHPKPPLTLRNSPLANLLPMLTAIRGRVGDVVYKTYGRKIVVTRVPRFDGYVPTAAQRDRRDRMREATAYAKRIYADPAAKAIYAAAARKLGRQPFRLAISDYLNAGDASDRSRRSVQVSDRLRRVLTCRTALSAPHTSAPEPILFQCAHLPLYKTAPSSVHTDSQVQKRMSMHPLKTGGKIESENRPYRWCAEGGSPSKMRHAESLALRPHLF